MGFIATHAHVYLKRVPLSDLTLATWKLIISEIEANNLHLTGKINPQFIKDSTKPIILQSNNSNDDIEKINSKYIINSGYQFISTLLSL